MKSTLFILLLLTFSLSSCKKLDKLTQFNMAFSEMVTIPATAGINLPLNLFTPPITTNSESTFAINDTRKDLIEEIVLTELNLTLTSPSNGDFGFVKSVEVYLSADNLPEIRVAWIDNVPANAGTYLELQPSSADLKEYIKKDVFALRLKTVTDEFITSDHQIEVKSVFFVDAKILGQ